MITHDAHSVVLRVNSRPEKCRAGVHTSVRSPIRWLSCQSSSTMRLSGIRHLRRCAPTPERHHERRALAVGQRDDGVHVEVVVVVVADEHRIQRRQRLQRHRHLVHPLGADRP